MDYNNSFQQMKTPERRFGLKTNATVGGVVAGEIMQLVLTYVYE